LSFPQQESSSKQFCKYPPPSTRCVSLTPFRKTEVFVRRYTQCCLQIKISPAAWWIRPCTWLMLSLCLYSADVSSRYATSLKSLSKMPWTRAIMLNIFCRCTSRRLRTNSSRLRSAQSRQNNLRCLPFGLGIDALFLPHGLVMSIVYSCSPSCTKCFPSPSLTFVPLQSLADVFC
jgi:hypothetical protein